MPTLNEEDQKRIDVAFEHGADSVSPKDMTALMGKEDEVKRKASNLQDQFENFKLAWAFVKAYWEGEYKVVPWKTIASFVFAILYVLNPFDIIPDVIPLLGYVDDITIFTLVVKASQSDLDAFKEWKNTQETKEIQ